MKKALTQTIIVFVAVNLITAGFAPAQNVSEEESQPASKEAVVAEKEIELERKKAEIEAKVAEKEAEIVEKKAEIEAKVAQKEAEVAAELQKQLEQLEGTKQLEAAQKQMQAQLRQLLAERKRLEVIPSMPAMPSIPNVNIPLWQHSGGGAVLVIPAAELKGEDLAAITEDMSVMSRIFDNKLSQGHLTTGRASLFAGFDPFSGRNSGTTEAIYLEGYAALFLMKVNVLLSPQPEGPEEKETEEEDTDPLWTQMRQEIYAPEEAGRRGRLGDSPEEKYDAEKVEELKETLIKTLKHAANIRALKPDQSVILTVIGGRGQSGTRTTTRSYGRSSGALYGSRSGRGSYITTTPGGAESGSFLPTVLTICVKKSDINAFAKGELSFDQFRQRTKIFTSYAKVGKEDSPGVEERTIAQVR